MDQAPAITQNIINNPPEDLQSLMVDSRTTDEARAAIADIAQPGTALSHLHKDTNGTGDGRLQIVNEHQEFS